MERESSLGGRLRRLMEEEGLSYEQLGERLGMNPQTLNRYVLGQREPKIGTASAMASISERPTSRGTMTRPQPRSR